MFTRARHRLLSWARCITSTPPHAISLRSILILSYHLCLGLPSRSLPFKYFRKNFVCISHLSHTCYLPRQLDIYKAISLGFEAQCLKTIMRRHYLTSAWSFIIVIRACGVWMKETNCPPSPQKTQQEQTLRCIPAVNGPKQEWKQFRTRSFYFRTAERCYKRHVVMLAPSV
jgi:hypothetical protein